MKKFLVIVLCMMVIFQSQAQTVTSALTYKCKNGWVINKGDTIKLGSPTGESFYQVGNKTSSRGNKKQLPGIYKDSVFNIERITKYKWDDGYREAMITIMVAGDKYYLDIDKAIRTGEIVTPAGFEQGVTPKRNMEDDLNADQMKYERLVDSIPLKDGKIFYDRIVDAKGMKKDDLFVQLRRWLIEEFVDARSVLDVNDNDRGILTGKGTYSYFEKHGLIMQCGFVTFIINIAAKDDKFRYQVYNFSSKGIKDDYFWGTRTGETFDMDDVLRGYQTGNGATKKLAKKYLLKLTWLADYLDGSINKIASKKLNDISDTSNISDF